MTETAIDLRHELHSHPELSGRESATAARVQSFFQALDPDRVLQGLGGEGLAFVFAGEAPGPRVLLRCDMDALPIEESEPLPHRSRCPGVSHKCGHDGHMAILAAVAEALARRRPLRGEVVLLYQPAEETGQGARAVLEDPRFESVKPDFCFALHNIPGYPLGQVLVRDGAFSCASRGMAIKLGGKTAHAAQPETGRSPAAAMCQIIEQLSSLPPELLPPNELAFATVVGSRLGEKAFGTAPGEAEIWVTLRAETDDTMAKLVNHAEELVERLADRDRLQHRIDYQDVFPATHNAPAAVEQIRACVPPDALTELERPFRWSEDFGRFTAVAPGALFGIGAGEEMPELHHPDYDFPDELITPASALFLRILERCLNG